jgi:general secretion pathway protein C
LVIFLGITLAKLLWMVLTPEDKIIAQVASAQNNAMIKPKKQQNYGRIIAKQHLFGVVEKKGVAPPPAQPIKVVAPKPPEVIIPKLNVKLFGIMSYSSKTSGYALLSYNRKAQAVYEVGDNLNRDDKEKKVFVHSISAEKVVISNHGQLEDVLLPKNSEFSSKGGVVIAANAGSINNSPASIPQPPRTRAKTPNDFMLGSSPAIAESAPPQPIKAVGVAKSEAFSIKNMAEFRNKVMADPSKLMEIATAQPYTKDGQMMGFRVRPGKNRRAFRQLGLRNGDVVKDVNGIAMDSAEKGIMLMSELSGASELSITVLRGKREVQLPTLHF